MNLINNKGQLEYPIIGFLAVVVVLLFLAPFILKLGNSILSPLSAKLGNQTAVAGANVAYVQNTLVGFWDFILIIAFLVNVILLFVSAYYLDTHPLFLVLYIIFNFVTIIFIPNLTEMLNKIYDSPQFLLETSQIPMMDFIRNNLAVLILGIMILAGFVIYAKVRFVKGGGGSSALQY